MKSNYKYTLSKSKIKELAMQAAEQQLKDVAIRVENRFKLALLNSGVLASEINEYSEEFLRLSQENSKLAEDQTADYQVYSYLIENGVKANIPENEI